MIAVRVGSRVEIDSIGDRLDGELATIVSIDSNSAVVILDSYHLDPLDLASKGLSVRIQANHLREARG